MNIYDNFYIQQLLKISLPNKYTVWYTNIVINALKRALTRKEAKFLLGYVESHHILPKSFKMGGENDPANIVHLTAKEHIVCHHLLTKMLTGTLKAKMVNALWRSVSSKEKISAVLYENSKKLMKEHQSSEKAGIKKSEETKRKMKQYHQNRSAEHQNRLNAASKLRKGFKHSEETLKKLSEITKKSMTPERRAINSARQTGRKWSKEDIEKRLATRKRNFELKKLENIGTIVTG